MLPGDTGSGPGTKPPFGLSCDSVACVAATTELITDRNMRPLRFIAVVATLTLTACPSPPPTARDKNDTTPPKITLSVTASTNTADGTEIVAPGSTMPVSSSWRSILGPERVLYVVQRCNQP